MELIIIAIVLYFVLKAHNEKKDQRQKREYPDHNYQPPNNTHWKWNEQKQVWENTDYQPEVRIERNGPTYEEWKANKLRAQGSDMYQYRGTDIPKDDTILYREPVIKQPENTTRNHYHNTQSYTPPRQSERNRKNAEYQGAYQAADIFTRNEAYNYKTLKEAADRKGYLICPKVRLADIITPRRDANYMSRFGKIKSKHVDFVIYNHDMRRLVAVIELDDSSHDRQDRIDRDDFVDYILEDAGYRVIHTRYITPDILDNI